MKRLLSLIFIILSVIALCFIVITGPLPFFATALQFLQPGASSPNGFAPDMALQQKEIDWTSVFSALRFSLWQSFFSAGIAVFLASISARILFFCDHKVGRYFLAIAQVPFGLPSILVAFAFVITYGNSGIINQSLGYFGQEIPFLYNRWTIVHAHVFFNFGMCTAQILSRYHKIPSEQWRSADSLSLTQAQKFWHIERQQLAPTILNLFLLVFLYSMSSFAIVFALGGSPAFTTLEVLIYQFVRYDLNFNSAFAAASLQFLVLLCAAFPLALLSKKESNHTDISLDHHNFTAQNGKKDMKWPLLILLFSAGLFAVFPLIGLLSDGIHSIVKIMHHSALYSAEHSDLKSIKETFSDIGASLLQTSFVALPVGILSTFVSYCAAQALVRMASWRETAVMVHAAKAKSRAPKIALETLSFSLLAISPTMLSFSWFWQMTHLQLDPFAAPLLTVILIESFLFAPFGLRLFYPLLKTMRQNWFSTYQALGIPLGVQTLVIEFKAMRKSIAQTFLLVFAFSIGEVSIPALFGSTDFRPLPILLLEYMGSYQFEKASIAAVIILALTQLLFLLGSRKKSYA